MECTAAVSRRGLIHLKVDTRYNRAAEFIDFLVELDRKVADSKIDKSKVFLFIDNSPIHTAKAT